MREEGTGLVDYKILDIAPLNKLASIYSVKTIFYYSEKV